MLLCGSNSWNLFSTLNHMRTEAIILHTQPWREHDLLVHCYTEGAGVVRAIARSALRDGSVQSMHLGQGHLVQFELVPGKGMPIVTGAFAIDTFPNIRADLSRQAAAWNLLQSVDVLVTGQERDEGLWHAIKNQLGRLNTCDAADILYVLRGAQRDMLSILGYTPQMGTCGVCGAIPNGEPVSFSVELGSMVCSRCVQSGWHGVALADDDRRWLAGEELRASCTVRAQRAPTEYLMEYISGKRLHSLDLLFGALKT